MPTHLIQKIAKLMILFAYIFTSLIGVLNGVFKDLETTNIFYIILVTVAYLAITYYILTKVDIIVKNKDLQQ